MSTAYELISASLNEIIRDLEDNDGQKLRREVLIDNPKIIPPQNTARHQQRPEEQNRVASA